MKVHIMGPKILMYFIINHYCFHLIEMLTLNLNHLFLILNFFIKLALKFVLLFPLILELPPSHQDMICLFYFFKVLLMNCTLYFIFSYFQFSCFRSIIYLNYLQSINFQFLIFLNFVMVLLNQFLLYILLTYYYWSDFFK